MKTPIRCELFSSIPDWIIEYPETSPVFDALQLDSSCGGKSLEHVCINKGLNPALVVRQLEETIGNHEKVANKSRADG